MRSPVSSPRNEYSDPFSRRPSDDTPQTVFQSPLSNRHSSMPSVSESIFRPPLRHGASSGSIHTSSTDDSRRKSSALVLTPVPRDSDISSELDLQSVMRASLAIQEGPQVKTITVKLMRIIMQTAGANYGCVMLREERKMLRIEVVGNANKVNVVDHKPLHSQTDVVPARLCEYELLMYRLIVER